MKAIRIASIGLAALFVLAPGANAQQASTTVSYVPKLFPALHSYPGASADILGIRVGMTVSQAETIAEKSYPSKTNTPSVWTDFGTLSGTRTFQLSLIPMSLL